MTVKLLGTNFLIVETLEKPRHTKKCSLGLGPPTSLAGWPSDSTNYYTPTPFLHFTTGLGTSGLKRKQAVVALFCQPHHHLISTTKVQNVHLSWKSYGLSARAYSFFTAKLLSLMKTYSVILWVVKIYFNLENKMPFIFWTQPFSFFASKDFEFFKSEVGEKRIFPKGKVFLKGVG